MDCNPVPDRVKNLTGMAFGRLEVLAYAGLNERGKAMWLCRCSGPNCDGKRVTVRSDRLRSGNTVSCGCVSRERISERNRARTTHGLHKHPLYTVWSGMLDRCTNPNHTRYADYGGRGVSVCEEWRDSFEAFYRDMSTGYGPGLQLDRRDNSLGYSPSNCQWVTSSQNGRNRRNNRVVEFAGQPRCLAEWAELLGMHRGTLRDRLERGWPVARALTEGVAPERLAELGLTE